MTFAAASVTIFRTQLCMVADCNRAAMFTRCNSLVVTGTFNLEVSGVLSIAIVRKG